MGQAKNNSRLAEIILFITVIIFIGSSAWAAQHPVPLDPKADSSTCLACHEDKTKGKSVHSAMAMGCTSCHEIRVNRDITRVKLTTSTPQALCLSCHADKDASKMSGEVHPPAVRDCIKCHDPHSSNNKNQLLKPMMGDKGKNLCLDCHTEGLNVSDKGSHHAALESGCDTCHITHKTGERGKEEFDFHLTKAPPALCQDCHDVKDAALIKTHQGQPFATANCTQCHNPHQSAEPKLLQTFTHAPFESKSCDTCHAPAKDGKVVLVNKDIKTLCVSCHSDVADKIDKSAVPHPGAQGDCTSCHNPHAGRTPGFIQPDPVNVCLSCHTDQADGAKKAYLHQPAYKQGCATCHEAHGSSNQHLMRTKTVDPLCLECHGADSVPQKLESEHMMAIFSGSVKLPEDYFNKNNAFVLPVKFGRGHPVDGHPVSDVVDPKDISKVMTKIDCMTCHQPHSSTHPDLLVKDQANNALFCANCHKDLTKR